jgi:arsenical pump membrane protein
MSVSSAIWRRCTKGPNIGLVGTIAAVGSALLNNHPMAIINLLALEATSSAGDREILAALIGGDLGPRLLPIGSLAGLLWLESCRRWGVRISLRQFVGVGFAVTLLTLLVSLLILALR